MTGFVQIIESKTSKLDEMMAFNDEWRQRFPDLGPSRVFSSLSARTATTKGPS